VSINLQEGTASMNKRRFLTTGPLALAALPAGIACASAEEDIAGAKAASDAFYAALKELDDGAAMSKVFAQVPYATFVGPRKKAVIVGWNGIHAYFAKANILSERKCMWQATSPGSSGLKAAKPCWPMASLPQSAGSPRIFMKSRRMAAGSWCPTTCSLALRLRCQLERRVASRGVPTKRMLDRQGIHGTPK
jgi:hypothetical protein